MKHQSFCYRNIKGINYINFADLIYPDHENEFIIKQAKDKYHKVHKIKHPSGYYQIFVANPKRAN